MMRRQTAWRPILARTPLVLAVVLPLAGDSCGPGPFDPSDVDQVSITLAVSGGLTGQAYSFIVDGSALEARGVECTSFCDFEPGEVLLPLSGAQVADLARRLEEAEVFSRGGDFGNECCDQISYALAYGNGARTAHVSGTLSTMPTELASAITHLVPIGSRRAPTLVSADTGPADWPRDAHVLGEVAVTGLELRADLTYAGGCGAHAMDLVAWGGWLESDPVQVNALITHDGRGDSCEALIADTRRFDLGPLVEAWVAAYGSGGGDDRRLVLRLAEPGAGGDAVRTLEIRF